MPLPKITTKKTNGNLGRVAPSKDGISLIIASGVEVTDKIVFNQLLGPFYSPFDAEAAGINQAYDDTNKLLAYQHIVDFYEEGALGTELYVMIVATTVTMTQMVDKDNNYIAKALRDKLGFIKLVAITRIPDAGYAPTVVSHFDDDVMTAVVKAQELVNYEFEHYRPVQILVEGRDFQGTPAQAKDLRNKVTGLNSNAVSVVISANPEISAKDAKYTAYANVCAALGRMSAIPVQRNIGRVLDGTLNLTDAALSNGESISTFNQDTDFEGLHDKGYIFIRKHPMKAGFYFNDDNTASPADDDYFSASNGRTMDKAVRLTVETLVNDILDDVEVADDGTLPAPVVKAMEEDLEKYIRKNMLGEISKVEVYIAPGQDFLGTDNVNYEVSVIKRGTKRYLTVKFGFKNPQNV